MRARSCEPIRRRPEPADGEDQRVKAFRIPKPGKVKTNRRRLTPGAAFEPRPEPCRAPRAGVFVGAGECFQGKSRFFDRGRGSRKSAPAAISGLRREQPSLSVMDHFRNDTQLVQSDEHLRGAVGGVFLLRFVLVAKP